MKVINKSQYKVTDWSGGQTTELYIYPENSSISDRNFKFRISSASFTDTKSVFSDFSGYQRYLLPLTGFIKLDHSGLYKRHLDPFEVDYFDGRWNTHSENSLDTLDYNFIVKNGSDATVEIIYEEKSVSTKDYNHYLYSPGNFVILLSDEEHTIESGDLCILNENYKIVSLDQPVIVCKYKI